MEGQFSFIKYLPYPERDEGINIGMVLMSDDRRKVWTKFLDKFPSSRSLSYLVPNEDVVGSVIRQLEKTLKSDEKKPVELVKNLSNSLSNSIQFSVFHPCSFEQPQSFLDAMYEKLVKPPYEAPHLIHHVKSRLVLVGSIHSAVRKAGLEHSVRRNLDVAGTFAKHRIDFVHRNAKTTLIHALTIDLSDDFQYIDKTFAWEGRVNDVLKSQPKSEFNLVVDMAPSDLQGRKSKVRDKLESAGAKLYEEDEIPKIVSKISKA